MKSEKWRSESNGNNIMFFSEIPFTKKEISLMEEMSYSCHRRSKTQNQVVWVW